MSQSSTSTMTRMAMRVARPSSPPCWFGCQRAAFLCAHWCVYSRALWFFAVPQRRLPWVLEAGAWWWVGGLAWLPVPLYGRTPALARGCVCVCVFGI